MGIVAAQCRVFIAQNDICAPRPLYYHLFFLDNRCVPARSSLRRLPDSLLLLSISPAFHAPFRLVSLLGPLFEPPGEPSRLRFRLRWVFPHRLSGVSCAVPVGFSLALSMFFDVYRTLPQSESKREGRSVLFQTECPMPSLRSPFRSPARWTRRAAFRGVGRGGRRGVLWYVSRETGNFPVHFTMLTWCRFINHTCMSDVPVRWMDAVPCRRHVMQGVPYIAVCGVFRPSPSVCRLAVKRYRSAYMVVPPLFSFLGGSGSGTASWRVLGYSWVL